MHFTVLYIPRTESSSLSTINFKQFNKKCRFDWEKYIMIIYKIIHNKIQDFIYHTQLCIGKVDVMWRHFRFLKKN